MSILYISHQAEGAMLNGTLVEKQNSEPKDGHPDGERGKIVGSMGPFDKQMPWWWKGEHPGLDCKYGYFVLWDGTPGVPVFTMESKVKRY